MMAHESRRNVIEALVQAARVAQEKSVDENDASFAFGVNLAMSDQGPAAAVKFATMCGILAGEIIRLRDELSSLEPGPSPASAD